jgi:cob(I)alamin adenosyltransferase
VDEINSLLGFTKTQTAKPTAKILETVQQHLFIIQAALGGAPKKITPAKVKWLEKITDQAEKAMPPIKTFRVPGGLPAAALLDYARTVARRAERRAVAVHEREPLSPQTLAYLNRLSSLLYALARLTNHQAGVAETLPNYK